MNRKLIMAFVFMIFFLSLLSIGVEAWWNPNWQNYKNTIIHADSMNHINDFFNFNISGIRLATNNCMKELRAIDDADNELDFIIIDDTGQSLSSGSQWCIVGINYTVNANTDRDIFWYYNYASAEIPSYMDEELGFDVGYAAKWMGGKYVPNDGYGWGTTGSPVGTNIAVPEEGNRWHFKQTQGANTYGWYEAGAHLLNETIVFRFNTSDKYFQHLSRTCVTIGNSSNSVTAILSKDTVELYWSVDSTEYGHTASITGTILTTYRLTWKGSGGTGDSNVTMYVYDQPDGTARTVVSTIAQGTAPATKLFFGDCSAGGGAHVEYWDFVGYNLQEAYPPLPFTLGAEQTYETVSTTTTIPTTTTTTTPTTTTTQPVTTTTQPVTTTPPTTTVPPTTTILTTTTTIVIGCPTCPSPSAWSECVMGKQMRTNYRCSAETNYECQSYTETRDCKTTTAPSVSPTMPVAPKIPSETIVEWLQNYPIWIVIGLLVLGTVYALGRVQSVRSELKVKKKLKRVKLKHCPNCGKELDERDRKFCTKCGANL